MNNNTKTERQRALRQAVLEEGLGDQHRLLEVMLKRGFATTQATVSRDLQEMGFVKIRVGQGEYKYELLEKTPDDVTWERLRLMFHNFVKGIKAAKNMLLIKTSPGNAHGVASLIDSIERPDVLGTVAGDDTILVIIDTERNRAKVESAFRRLL